jgi:hypothetical protein
MTFERELVLYKRENALVDRQIADDIEQKMQQFRNKRARTLENSEGSTPEKEWQPDGDMADPYTFTG